MSGITRGGASDSTAKATCTTRTCDLAIALVEPAEESWTRMDDEDHDGDHDERDEAEQLEELKSLVGCSPAFRPGEAEAFSDESGVRTLVRSVCQSKGTGGAQHRRQAIKELAKQEQDGPRIYSDFFYMSEAGVSTPMLAVKFSRSGRILATALEQKGLTQYGVKFFAGFIQQTGVRRFLNKSDGEPVMRALKGAAAKALEGVEIGQESPVVDRQANGAIESAVRTLKALMRATRFVLQSTLGRQLAHDCAILMWIPTFAGDTISRFRNGPDGKTPREREQGRKWAGDSLECGERFFMKKPRSEEQKLSRRIGSRGS